jgi:hypothetical protein
MNNQYLIKNVFVFERMRLGNKTITKSGERYGQYLYRNTKNGELISSWEKPIKNVIICIKVKILD